MGDQISFYQWYLNHKAEMTQKEMAKHLNMNASTFRGRIARYKKKFSSLLKTPTSRYRISGAGYAEDETISNTEVIYDV